jgi:hypothetical protein
MEKQENTSDYLKELWLAFEKTGSIGAYLLYNDIKKKAQKAGRIRDKKVDVGQ